MTDLESSSVCCPVTFVGKVRVGSVDKKILDVSPCQVSAIGRDVQCQVIESEYSLNNATNIKYCVNLIVAKIVASVRESHTKT